MHVCSVVGANTLPPAPNAVPVTHPLMNPSSAAAASEVHRGNSRFVPGLSRMRRNAGGAGAAARADRLGADRLGQSLHLMSNNAPTSSTFLQRSVVLPAQHGLIYG